MTHFAYTYTPEVGLRRAINRKLRARGGNDERLKVGGVIIKLRWGAATPLPPPRQGLEKNAPRRPETCGEIALKLDPAHQPIKGGIKFLIRLKAVLTNEEGGNLIYALVGVSSFV